MVHVLIGVLEVIQIMHVIKILYIAEKFIPLPPVSFDINPLKSSVVAFPNILGPTIENTVDNIARMKTINSFIL